MMKELLNSVIAKYQSSFVSGEQINYLLRPQHSASANNCRDLLATGKTRYFAKPCAITFNYIID